MSPLTFIMRGKEKGGEGMQDFGDMTCAHRLPAAIKVPIAELAFETYYKEVSLCWRGYVFLKGYDYALHDPKLLYWHSSDPEVATIDCCSGYITAKRAGETKISVRISDTGICISCMLRVLPESK